jgi:hypothetical protein
MDLLKLAAAALDQPVVRCPDTGKMVKSFWVMVLIDLKGLHSFHCVMDQTPQDRVWGQIETKGWTRSLWVLADNMQEAIVMAIEKGILVT